MSSAVQALNYDYNVIWRTTIIKISTHLLNTAKPNWPCWTTFLIHVSLSDEGTHRWPCSIMTSRIRLAQENRELLYIYIYIYIYSASQIKRNRELLMFYHNLITFIITKWQIFGKQRSSSFIWCTSDDAYFMHEWLKTIGSFVFFVHGWSSTKRS